jgi:hypothetical protein
LIADEIRLESPVDPVLSSQIQIERGQQIENVRRCQLLLEELASDLASDEVSRLALVVDFAFSTFIKELEHRVRATFPSSVERSILFSQFPDRLPASRWPHPRWARRQPEPWSDLPGRVLTRPFPRLYLAQQPFVPDEVNEIIKEVGLI